jgi:Co/Zn/Cd efflux system component
MDCGCEVKIDSVAQQRVLSIALVLNATMFVVGVIAGLIAQSSGLIADSLDMLADATAYGIAVSAVHRDDLYKARAASVSGLRIVQNLGLSGIRP